MTVRRRYLTLTAVRWFPVGLLIPVFTLLWIDRGVDLSEIGLVFGVQALTVFVLELPTGGLADALGRRPVLAVATLIDVAALVVVVVGESISMFALASLLMGVYRALESGPLEAWVVDALDADADVEGVLGGGGITTGLSIALGALLGGVLVAIGPLGGVDVLLLPVIAALAARMLDFTVIVALMNEPRRSGGLASVRRSTRAVPAVIVDALGTIRASRVLAALVTVELFWGFGMVAGETLPPVRLAEVVGGTERAAELFGPASTAAWIASAAGAWVAIRLARRTGTPVGAMVFHGFQAAGMIAMAYASGAAGVIGFYLVTLGAHGGVNPLYQALLHAQATAENRTTVLSAASMAAFPGYAIGGIVLGALAESWSVTAAIVGGGLAILLTIPFYLPAQRARRAHLAQRPSS